MWPFCLVLLLLEVVFVFAHRVARIQQGVVGERDSGWIADAKVNTCRVFTGRLCGNFFFTDDVQFPPTFASVVDSTHLLNIVSFDFWWCLVLAKDVVTSVFVVFAFAQTDSVVFRVVANAFVLPRDGRTRMFFVDSVAVTIVVVGFAVARWVIPVVVGAKPRTEGFSKLFENFLAGLGMQSFVFWMSFQFVFEFAFIGYFTGFVPLLAGVVVGDVVRLCLTGSQTESENVPEFGCRPAVSVNCTSHLRVVLDTANVGTACCRHSVHIVMNRYFLIVVEYPAVVYLVDCG
jgi:hypothetical protein